MSQKYHVQEIKKMQNSVSAAWSSGTLNIEVVTHVIANGLPINQALANGLEDQMIEAAVFNWYGFSMACFLLAIVVACIGSDNLLIGEFLSRLLLLFWRIQTGATILIILPLSRLWLPQKVVDGMLALVNLGRECYMAVVTIAGGCFIVILAFIPLMFLHLFLKIIKVFMIQPWLTDKTFERLILP